MIGKMKTRIKVNKQIEVQAAGPLWLFVLIPVLGLVYSLFMVRKAIEHKVINFDGTTNKIDKDKLDGKY